MTTKLLDELLDELEGLKANYTEDAEEAQQLLDAADKHKRKVDEKLHHLRNAIQYLTNLRNCAPAEGGVL